MLGAVSLSLIDRLTAHLYIDRWLLTFPSDELLGPILGKAYQPASTRHFYFLEMASSTYKDPEELSSKTLLGCYVPL